MHPLTTYYLLFSIIWSLKSLPTHMGNFTSDFVRLLLTRIRSCRHQVIQQLTVDFDGSFSWHCIWNFSLQKLIFIYIPIDPFQSICYKFLRPVTLRFHFIQCFVICMHLSILVFNTFVISTNFVLRTHPSPSSTLYNLLWSNSIALNFCLRHLFIHYTSCLLSIIIPHDNYDSTVD